jgi:hypothetical protein
MCSTREVPMNPNPYFPLYAAIITLSGTMLAAAIVAPWAQARSRRRERWETAVSELSALIEDELKRALDRFAHVAAVERGVIAMRINKRTPPEEIERLTQDQRHAREEAAEALDGPMIRLVTLSDILRTRKRRRVEWVEMFLLVVDLRSKVETMKDPPNSRVDETDIFRHHEAEVKKARTDLSNHLKPIRELMRLRRPILDPFWRQARRLLEPVLWPAILLRGRLAKWLAEVESRQNERRQQRSAQE